MKEERSQYQGLSPYAFCLDCDATFEWLKGKKDGHRVEVKDLEDLKCPECDSAYIVLTSSNIEVL